MAMIRHFQQVAYCLGKWHRVQFLAVDVDDMRKEQYDHPGISWFT
jgi:hypothetical protein